MFYSDGISFVPILRVHKYPFRLTEDCQPAVQWLLGCVSNKWKHHRVPPSPYGNSYGNSYWNSIRASNLNLLFQHLPAIFCLVSRPQVPHSSGRRISATGPQGFWGKEAQLIMSQDDWSVLKCLELEMVHGCPWEKPGKTSRIPMGLTMEAPYHMMIYYDYNIPKTHQNLCDSIITLGYF